MTKITENQLIERLRELKEITPDENWAVFCRQNLVSMFENGREQKMAVNANSIGFFTWLRQLNVFGPALKPISIMTVVFVLIFSSSLGALTMAKESLPGDRLYSVKIALEQARLFTTTSAEGKAEFQSEMIASRLDELNRVINASDSIEARQPRIEQAVTNLQRYLLTAKDDLPKLSGTDAKKAVEVAKKIDKNAVQAEHALGQARLTLSAEMKPSLAEKITEAADEADKTSTKALEMMMSKQSDAGDQADIVANLGEKIQKTEMRIKNLEMSVASSTISNKLAINATIILDESDKAVSQAKESLQNNDTVAALEMIKAINEMVKNAEKIVESGNATPAAGSDADKAAEPVSDKKNASSTENALPSATSTSSYIELPLTIPPAPIQVTTF
ncbi:MAG: DUF5667 domain-containing protein [bacterium]